MGSNLAFTGERVVPGQVDPNLWQEHLSRYAMAAGLARGCRVLDAGCGCGYGTALLAESAREAVGLDLSYEALAYAQQHYQAGNLRFVRGDCAALPFPDAHFNLLVAFEVIEHLPNAEAFLGQARRVLHPQGCVLISTPNRRYYTEERGFQNPYHVREFDAAEFDAVLATHFEHRLLLAQNHVEAISFAAPGQAGAVEFSGRVAGSADHDEPHFFLAVCSQEPLPPLRNFLFLAQGGNILRERELHIRKLEGDMENLKAELRKKGDFIRGLQQEFAERTAWAQELEVRLAERDERLLERQQAVEKLEAELAERAAWAKSLEADLVDRDARLLERQQTVEKQEAELAARAEWAHRLDRELEERTAWARRLDAELDSLRADMRLLLGSLWYRVGKNLRLSPVPEVDRRASEAKSEPGRSPANTKGPTS